MLYQLGIILIIIVAAVIISRGFRSNNNGLIYEDEMDQGTPQTTTDVCKAVNPPL